MFPEQNKNKLIDVHMVYVFGDYYKYNVIWGRDLNTWWIMVNNKNLWIEAARYMIELPMICVVIYIPHVSNK